MARVGAGSVSSALGIYPPFVWLGAASGRFAKLAAASDENLIGGLVVTGLNARIFLDKRASFGQSCRTFRRVCAVLRPASASEDTCAHARL